MEPAIWVNGWWEPTFAKEREFKFGPMALFTRDIGVLTKRMATGDSCTKMEIYTGGSGLMTQLTDSVFTSTKTVVGLEATGNSTVKMGRESKSGQMVRCMRVSTRRGSKMGRVSLLGPTGTVTKAILSTIIFTGMESIFGRTVASILANGKTTKCMGMAF